MKVEWHHYNYGNPAGQPMIFLHGFMAHGKIWLPTMEQLPKSIYCMAPDLPGHGKTKADLACLTFDSVADAIIEFVTDHCNRPPFLFGYSLGGRIALYTALKYPEKFAALMLESATPGIENSEEREKRLRLDQARADELRSVDIETYLTKWYRMPVFTSLNQKPDLVKRIIQKKSGNDTISLAEVIVRLSPGVQPPLWSMLELWEKPTLIIAGELDEKFHAIARRMAAGIKNSEMQSISGAGHIVHMENNKDFAAALNFFLSSLIL